jgi:hypothetical protein
VACAAAIFDIALLITTGVNAILLLVAGAGMLLVVSQTKRRVQSALAIPRRSFYPPSRELRYSTGLA